ncbi:GAF and ANTAR domain-containing protein [Allokutzneria albata]|uniref:GAF domain-containing protein n=1 Tax=Allokutzneria albata TaxID=211114 RepID=A0A1G9TJZ8_ALLAB|nr:GAF and ANTAR domain-containing protein [Allokutzneria albata]SDM47912.1 GAF domain-containing protein [Allokutzneria albata]
MTIPQHRELALMAALVDLADTMVADYDVVDLMHRLATHCVALLPVAAAGLLLTDEQGALRLVASSNEQAHLLELFQLETDQAGPCLEAFHSSRPIMVVDLARDGGRWPAFAAETRRQGYQAVFALPMRLREMTIGALNLFGAKSIPLSEGDQRLGQALADVATIGILQQRALTRSETVIEQLQGALSSRIVIEQAKGILAALGGIDVSAAFVVLRDHARRNSLRMSELAAKVGTDPDLARRLVRRSAE